MAGGEEQHSNGGRAQKRGRADSDGDVVHDVSYEYGAFALYIGRLACF